MAFDTSSVEFLTDSTFFLADTTVRANLFKPCATFTCGARLNDPSNSDPNIKLNRYGFVYSGYGSNFKPGTDKFPSGNALHPRTYLYTAKAVNNNNKVYFTFGYDAAPLDSYYGLSGDIYIQCALSCDGSFAPYIIQSTKTLPSAGWHMWNNKSAVPGADAYDILNAMHE